MTAWRSPNRFVTRGITVVHQENHGASAARNHGLRLAKGAFLQFLDADDLLAPEKIALQVEFAATRGPDMALCSTWSRFTSTPADADYAPQVLCRDADPVDWVVAKLENNAMVHPAAWLTPAP